jgi:hypothetical protein
MLSLFHQVMESIGHDKQIPISHLRVLNVYIEGIVQNSVESSAFNQNHIILPREDMVIPSSFETNTHLSTSGISAFAFQVQ